MNNINFDKCLHDLNTEGITIIDNAIPNILLSDLQIKFNRVINLKPSMGKSIGSTEEDELIWIDHPLALDRNIVKIAASEAISKIVSAYLNIEIQLGYTFAYRTKVMDNMTPEIQSLIKSPGVFKGWHSDANLSSSNRGYRCVVAMIYLTDVDKGDGGLWVIKGSHVYGGSQREWNENQFDISQIKEVTAKAGSLIIFDMEMIHRAGTPSNRVPRDIIRFMYTPIGSYCEDYLLPASFIDENFTNEQKKILKFSTTNITPISLSEVRVLRILKKNKFSTFIKKQLLKLLV